MEKSCAWAYGLAIFIFFVSAFYAIFVWRSRKRNYDKSNKKYALIKPLNIFFGGVLLASAIMSYPVYYYGRFEADVEYIRIFKSVLISLLNSLQMFLLNSDFSLVKEAIGGNLSNFALEYLYTSFFAALYIVAPFLTFTFLLTFFKYFLSRFKYEIGLHVNVYYLSELNERSMALARDIKKNGKGKKLIVFTNVSEDVEKKHEDLVDEAKKFGAVFLKADIADVKLKTFKLFNRKGKPKKKKLEIRRKKKILRKRGLYFKKKKLFTFNKERNDVRIKIYKYKTKRKKRVTYKRKLYFISDDENKNLKQALEIIGNCRGVYAYDNYDTQFYVFANGRESEVLLDSIDHSNMKVRRVTEYWNTILNTLKDCSVFKTPARACDSADVAKKGSDDNDVINVIVVGVGNYGEELIKMLCWMGQIPNCKINVHTFDKYDVEDRLRYVAPELIEKNGQETNGEPYYNIKFYYSDEKRKGDGIDVKSSKFCDEIEKIANAGRVTAAFVALGNDELNVEIAIKLRSIFGRAQILYDHPIPKIYALIINSVKSKIFSQYGDLTSALGKKFDIQFIDSVAANYNVEVIERERLERKGLRCHLAWVKVEDAYGNPIPLEQRRAEKVELIKKYERYEYYRKSSIAGSAHKDILKCFDDDFAKGKVTTNVSDLEHIRWNAYMRSEGYVFDKKKVESIRKNSDGTSIDEIKDDIARMHCSLVTTAELSEKNRAKDRNTSKSQAPYNADNE